ncbi:DUF6927 domain-containing protein [Streptomyces lydicus]|uniref:DUF6927 domain-containing protein n=1 Tax=Streptomyces lydicus TaxID=47763 RepID=UPI0010134A4C|nr:hypothetical protein [Streptomyces lydicus]MCZ1012051.1 hypothetical protein [Streptomyces lydicus]
MGWSFYHRAPGVETNAAHFTRKLGDRYEIIAHGTVETVFYAAIRSHKTGTVSAYVALTRWKHDRTHNFGYTAMDETCLPAAHKAPKAVLDALTPTTHQDALAWRANCVRYHDQHAFLRQQLKPGMRIRLTHPLRCADNIRRDAFTYGWTGGRKQGRLTDGPRRFPMPNWRELVAALIHPDGSETLTPVGKHQTTHHRSSPAPHSEQR